MTRHIETDVFIELHVPDFKAAIDFYSKLAFKVVWQTEGDQAYLVMRRGGSILNFYSGTEKVYEQSYFRRFPSTTVRGYAAEIIIPVDDIDALYRSAQKTFGIGGQHSTIVEELQLRPWKKKDFRMVDPFGFYLRFTERINWLIP